YKLVIRAIKKYRGSHRSKHLRVLEIGCADAKLFAQLNSEFHIQYNAIESNAEFYFQAMSKFADFPNFRLKHGDAAEKESYTALLKQDVIVCLETLEHMSKDDAMKTID